MVEPRTRDDDERRLASRNDKRAAAPLAVLARILESFTETLDLDEVVRRVVTITREELESDRAWLLAPVGDDSDDAGIAFEATLPEYPGAFARDERIPLGPSRHLLARTLASDHPLPFYSGDPDVSREMWEQYSIRSQLVQIIRPREGAPWAFGLHQCSYERKWRAQEIALFEQIGRYATLAINNALLHRRALSEAAKLNAILEQMPEAAAIYDTSGQLERMNAAARSEPYLAGTTSEDRVSGLTQVEPERKAMSVEDLPSIRALRGESVRTEVVVRDASGSEQVMQLRSGPIRDEEQNIIGSVVLAHDVTGERRKMERDAARRRRAEVLAGLGLDLFGAQVTPERLEQVAAHVGDAIGGNVFIFVYHPSADALVLEGSHVVRSGLRLAPFLRAHPYRPGEALPGTVFQLGRPLVFFEVRGDAVTSFARSEEEQRLLAELGEQSVIAVPIEASGEGVGALLLSISDHGRRFGPEDVEFAQAIAERIAVAARMTDLARGLQEGQRAAEELARREVDVRSRLEGVLDSAPVGIAVISADELRFELVNPLWIEFARHFGRISDETRLEGLRVAEVIPYLESQLQEVAEKGEVTVDEAVRVRFGRHNSYFNQIVAPVRGRFSGTVQSLTVLVQDVTDQVRAKREIEALARQMEERSARLDSILGSMTDALWVFDSRGRVIDVNPAALTMFGLASRAEAIGNASFENFELRYPDGAMIPAADMPFRRALRGEVFPDYIAVGRHLISGRDLDLSIAAAPISSGGAVVGAVLVIRDITALQELDRKKDEFLSVASHELRTPLTTIKGYSQLLAQSFDELAPAERRSYLTSVLAEIDRMMGLISELLDVSRIETNRLQLRLRPVVWRDFLKTQVETLRVQHPERRLELHLDLDDVEIEVDPDRMKQVLDNLLSNAVKYSAERSRVEVRSRRIGGQVETMIVDRGIGIPPDELSRLFERFHRARNVSSRYYGGLGLGLYITKAIVEAHGGSITVESREGEGSSFIVSLPVESPAARPQPEV